MNNTEVIQIMISLSDGINPMTGEVYGISSPYQDVQISKALLYAATKLSGQVLVNHKNAPIQLSLEDELLFEQLRSWRLRAAKRTELKLFQIFSNEVLKHIAYYKPRSHDQLLMIRGIGETKVRKYGDELVEMIQLYVIKYNR